MRYSQLSGQQILLTLSDSHNVIAAMLLLPSQNIRPLLRAALGFQ
jgi:hypothetical protein